MKKIKNKFIISVILLILFIVSTQVYNYYAKYTVDTNTYVMLISWKWFLNEVSLYEDERKKLNSWDTIRTTGDSSIAVIEWWDWSLTRLWWDSKLEINEAIVSKDKTKIKYDKYESETA